MPRVSVAAPSSWSGRRLVAVAVAMALLAMLVAAPPSSGDSATSDSGKVVWAINVGGPQVAGWTADTAEHPAPQLSGVSDTSDTWRNDGPLRRDDSASDDVPDEVWRWERYDVDPSTPMIYRLPVDTAGDYVVLLHLVEFFEPAQKPGGRTMRIEVNDEVIAARHDTFAAVGPNTATTLSHAVQLDADDDVKVELHRMAQAGHLMGLEVRRVDTHDNPQPPPRRDPDPMPTERPDPPPKPEPTPTEQPVPDPQPRPSAPPDDGGSCDGVTIAPGDDWGAVTGAHGPGTTYCVAAGVHREVEVDAQHGDRFIGAGRDRTILSGARDLTGAAWQPSGARWYVDGQTQQLPVATNCWEGYCKLLEGGNPRHLHPEELFVGDQRWDETTSLAQLDTAGEWYFDYGADRIWLAVDPAGLDRIETSTRARAIGGKGIRDVEVADLTVTRYGTAPQDGAIGEAHGATHDWTLRNVAATDNAGGGITIGPGMTIDGCLVTRNGQLGIGGAGLDRVTGSGYRAPVTVRGCEISHSPMLDYDWGWEGGATKFKYVDGLTFVDNHVHDAQVGIWFDVYNGRADIRRNLVEDIQWIGIFYEISHGPAVIADNVVRRVGDDGVSTWHGVYGILVSNSRDVEVVRNTVRDTGNPMGVAAKGRSNGRDTATTNIAFRDNDVTLESRPDSAGYVHAASTVATNVTWTHNTYRLTAGDDPRRFRLHHELSGDADWWRATVESTARMLVGDGS